jgi:hypothetical protein
MSSRSVNDNSRSVIDDSNLVIDDSRVTLHLVASIMIIIYDRHFLKVHVSGLTD